MQPKPFFLTICVLLKRRSVTLTLTVGLLFTVASIPLLGQPRAYVIALLDELGRRRLTNVLVEGGGEVLGSFLDACAVDEVHAFIAPCLIGGDAAATPVAGLGVERIAQSLSLADVQVETIGIDVLIHGRLEPGRKWEVRKTDNSKAS